MPGKVMYLSSTAVVLAEAVKLFTSVALLTYEKGGPKVAGSEIARHLSNARQTLPLAVPGILYTLQNNLLYLSLTNLSGAVHTVSYQLKILTTALLSVIMLGRTLNCEKWLSLLSLTIGVMMIQFPRNTTGVQSPGNPLIGLSAIIGACFTSGFAGVYLEKLMKESDTSVWIRNIQLAILGGVLGLIVSVVSDGDKINEGGFFQGYDALVWFVVVWNALSGIIVAMVLKYADNILKCFASAMSIILTCFVSFVSGEFFPDLLFGIGAFLVILSSMAYGGGLPLDKLGKFRQESKNVKLKCIASAGVLLTISTVLVMFFSSGDVASLLLPPSQLK
eukprot:gnl/MRDRNA2_/MRDRNA2_145765_c0_seq1.p1 gnl/MRDRNA2_/MRDRNA2_145765_c0~~gnl/MRDRNA2_/MRDRNA2_145765_c0_seq1.p1  ORF type:complete len:360 (+),score=46.60 gnl/MRDRNA2_/MRDRNA2_145765_c0_seq1:81-1082(+)